jgi:hypothetical protein
MLERHQTSKRTNLLRDLVAFHERRAKECESFHEPEARHHRDKADKLRLVLANIERKDNNK